MGVYVKNIKMPKSCEECVQEYEFYLFCDIGTSLLLDDDRDSDCPLIEIDLVRCGECKWWDKDGKRKDGKGWCENAICGLTESNAFCSYGERRADERITE